MADTILIRPGRVIFDSGKFDSNNRYLRRVSSGHDTTLLAGPSLAINPDGSFNAIGWRYQCGSYVISAPVVLLGKTRVPAPGNVANTPARVLFERNEPPSVPRGFTATAGRMRVVTPDGVSRLDTNDAMFHIVNAVQGSVSIPSVASTTSDRNITQTYNLGPCHGNCTHVIGAVRFSGSGNWGVAFGRWTTYLGGTLVWAATSPRQFQADPPGTIYRFIDTFNSYRFYAQGGQVRMERRVWICDTPAGVTIVILPHTITYKLKAGLFT